MNPAILDAAREMHHAGVPKYDIGAALRERFGLSTLKAMRLASGYSQQEVAELWNVRRPDNLIDFRYISAWETWFEGGRRGHQPSLETLSHLAELYQCSVADLLHGFGNHRIKPVPPAGTTNSARREAGQRMT
jgi:transcriptional regulator with XRE-family HTH domain